MVSRSYYDTCTLALPYGNLMVLWSTEDVLGGSRGVGVSVSIVNSTQRVSIRNLEKPYVTNIRRDRAREGVTIDHQ
jgi:hypothetical protein